MAAIIDIRTGASLTDPAHHLPAPHLARPQLRLVEGGRSSVGRQRRRVFFVRRVLALVALVAALFLAVQFGQVAVEAFSARSSAAAGSAAATIDASRPYVVQPGDTLWAVAEGVAPGADPRDVVRRIVELNSGDGTVVSADSPLQVGQRLVLPVDLD